MGLSGGELQRIALARAFTMVDKSPCILDEVTSHLDVNTEGSNQLCITALDEG